MPIPALPGTLPIPEGHVRRFHATGKNRLDTIRTEGLKYSNAKGVEGPRAIYSFPDYKSAESYGGLDADSDAGVVEFHTPADSFKSHPYAQLEDVPPEHILGIHEVWHDSYRHAKENNLTSKELRDVGMPKYDRVADEIDKESKVNEAVDALLEDKVSLGPAVADYEDEYSDVARNREQALDRDAEEAGFYSRENYLSWKKENETLAAGNKFHATSNAPERLPSIAKEGLKPNEGGKLGYNFKGGAADHSEGKLFLAGDEDDAKDWAGRVRSANKSLRGVDAPSAILRARDTAGVNIDTMSPHGSGKDQYRYEPVPTEKLDVWHSKAGWTPLAAHAPELWGKVRPGHLDPAVKPKGQMQLFPKELYNEAVMNIVNELLSETTFLQARAAGDLGKPEIKAMSAMRKAASEQFGQKIPVISTDRGEGYNGPSMATPEHLVGIGTGSRTADELLGLLRTMTPASPTEKLAHRLSNERAHVQINVQGNNDGDHEAKHAVAVTGHELGHVVDPVQNAVSHVYMDRQGRKQLRDEEWSLDKSRKTTPEIQKVMKSEGRAWRAGKGLQTQAGVLDTPESKDNWKQIAQSSLKSYAGNYLK